VTDNKSIVADLRSELLDSLSQLKHFGEYASVNIPAYSTNIGSHLLWLAEYLYFKNVRAANLVYASSAQLYSQEEMGRNLGDSPIVLRSGYLGDQWDTRNGRRRPLFESIVRDFSDNPIIFMPHSLEYFDPQKAGYASDLFARHPDITFIARDRRSYGNAQQLFPTCKTFLSPDMVFYLADVVNQIPRRATEDSILFLQRADWDCETSRVPEEFGISGLVRHEWRAEMSSDEQARFNSWWEEYAGTGELEGDFENGQLQAWKYLFLAVSQLTRHRLVITNRLHGHIMCTLLDIPHVLLQGPYRKMTEFRQVWTHGLDNCRFAGSVDQVREAVAELL
jgi:pyruvyl transferase EpsO